MEDWSWRMAVNAKTVGGHYVRVDLDGDGQPGYLATAKMLGEAGMLLAEEGATPGAQRLPDPGGGARHRQRSTASATPACGSRSPPSVARRGR